MRIRDLLKVEDEHLVKSNKQFSGRKPGVFWPSEASVIGELGPRVTSCIGGCHRAVYYSAIGTPWSDPPTAETVRKRRAGVLCEAEERRISLEAGTMVAIPEGQNKFEKKYGSVVVRGKEDIRHMVQGKLVIGEVKSGAGYSFYKMAEEQGFKQEHVLQLLFYLDARATDFGVIRYVDRASFHRWQVPVHTKDGVTVVNGREMPWLSVRRAVDRFTVVLENIRKKMPPRGDYTPFYARVEADRRFKAGLIPKSYYKQYLEGARPLGDWQCSYCYWKTVCINSQGYSGL